MKTKEKRTNEDEEERLLKSSTVRICTVFCIIELF